MLRQYRVCITVIVIGAGWKLMYFKAPRIVILVTIFMSCSSLTVDSCFSRSKFLDHNSLWPSARCTSGCVVVPNLQSRGCGFESRPARFYTIMIFQYDTPDILEYQLLLGRQRQVWLIPIVDERVGVQVKLWDPLRTRAIPGRFCGGDSLRRGAISSVCAFSFTFISWKSVSASLHFNGHSPGGSGLADTRTSPFWMLLELRIMEVVVTTGATRCTKLVISASPAFYRLDALPVSQPTVS